MEVANVQLFRVVLNSYIILSWEVDNKKKYGKGQGGVLFLKFSAD